MDSSWTSSRWLICLVVFWSMAQQAVAFRPVQHCKSLGEHGHYSACAALTQHYNSTTGVSDLYLRYKWYRYRNSKNGWHAFAIGEKMDGAYMVLMYGDPNTPSVPMTVDVRTSDGHSPPVPISQNSRLAASEREFEVVTAVFEEYKGNIEVTTDRGKEKPSHVGTCEAIIRGYEGWAGMPTSNTSTGMDFLWASNHDQNMNDDFSNGRAIDMHEFANGFGFLYVDILNAATPEPMFGPIDELGGLRGVHETHSPAAPTTEELLAGETYIAQSTGLEGNTSPPTTSTGSSNGGQQVEQPTRTLLGKTIRDWMWHLHGMMMILAFLILYPIGTYYIRSGQSTAFNTHWTVQSLGTVALGIGSLIGYMNSHSISIKHQYIGIFMVFAITAQIVLGWRHHVQFVATKRKGWLSTAHIILGRIVLPLGFVNIIMGMLLRGYGWFTMTLVIIVMGLESVFLVYVIARARKARAAPTELRGLENGPPTGDEAEEYFQLGGEDDFSDSDDEHDAARAAKEQDKKEQADKLRRLDKV